MGHHPDHRVAHTSGLGSRPLAATIGVGGLLAALILTTVVLLLGASAGADATTVGAVCHADGSASDVPARYRPLYTSAARRYRLGARGPAILASIHRHESGFGQNLGPSSAGAVGHMQFMPPTWAAYGVDANRDGTADPNNAADAIHGAANYLHASGAPANWASALFAYNHADWYVRMILDSADGYQDLCDKPAQTPTELSGLPTDRLQRLIQVASWIDQGRHPYCWGGGHATTPGPSTGSYCWTSTGIKAFGTNETGLDCSGAVRWLLVLAGYSDPGGITSGSFGDIYPSGPGKVVTIWSNAAHVFIHIRGKGFWGTTQTNYRHGPGWITTYPTSGFLSSHPAGL